MKKYNYEKFRKQKKTIIIFYNITASHNSENGKP